MDPRLRPDPAALLDLSPEAMLLADAVGLVRHANARAETLFRSPPGGLAGRALESLLPAAARRLEGGGEARLEGRPLAGDPFPAAVRAAAADGRLLLSVRDETAALRAREQRDRLLDAIPDALLVVDPRGRVELVNARACELFGYAPGELVGREVELLVPEASRAAHVRLRGSAAALHGRAMGSAGPGLRARRKDGSDFAADIGLSPLRGPEGARVVVTVRDATERRRIEEEQAALARERDAVRLRDEFLSMASHELKTPLTAMQMQIQGLLRPGRAEALGPEVSARLVSLRGSVRRLTTLIDRLLDVSLVQAGRLPLQRAPADLAFAVRAVTAQFREDAALGGCALKVDAERPVVGHWDALRLEQVVSALLSNAVKFGAGRPVSVSAGVEGGRAVLRVADHGIGIAAADQPRVFERFERAVSGRHYPGFGLGLWIAREIVRAHGGDIRVRSEPGAGAEFTVELPLAAEQRPSRPVEAVR